MRLKLRKILNQIKRHEFGPPKPAPYPVVDPGFRRRVRAPMCVR
jgi:hypothetical protein